MSDADSEGRKSLSTYSGLRVDLQNPRPEDVELRDISHALSMTCRFGGHTSRFFSSAEHSVLVSHVVPKHLALQALLHDAHVAYLGDVVSPLKDLLPGYRDLEMKWDDAISRRFGIALSPAHVDVREADQLALYHEAHCLFPGEAARVYTDAIPEGIKRHLRPLMRRQEILCLPQELAEAAFIDRCVELAK